MAGGIWDLANQEISDSFVVSNEQETNTGFDIWKDYTRKIDERFGVPARPHPSQAERVRMDEIDVMTGQDAINQRAKELADIGIGTGGEEQESSPMAQSPVSTADREVAEDAVLKEVRDRFGDRWNDLKTAEKEKIIEYETQRLLDKQFNLDTDYSTWGTIKHGLFTGLDDYSMMSNADKWFATKFPSLGGKFLAVNPNTGRREFFVGYNEVIPDFENLSEDDRREAIKTLHKQEQDRYAAAVKARQEGFTHGATQFVGALADPSTLIPVSKFGSGYKAMAYSGGTIGASDAFLWDMANEGHINPLHVGMGLVGGAALSVTFGAAFNKFHSMWNRRSANKMLDIYEKSYARMISNGQNREIAETIARFQAGDVTSDGLRDLYLVTNRTKPKLTSPHEARMVLDDKASFLARFKIFDKPREIAKKIGDGFNYIAQPISDITRQHAPRIYQAQQRMEQRIHDITHQWALEADPFFQLYGKISTGTRKELHKLLLTDSADTWGQAYKIMKELEIKDRNFAGLTDSFDKVREVFREIAVRYKQAGYEMDFLKHYFPRITIDGQINKKVSNSFLQKKISEAVQKNGGKPLSEAQLNKLINNLVNFKPKGKGKVATSGSLKTREIDELNDYLIPHYADLPAAFHSYARMAALDIERANFFRGFGKTKFSIYGDDLTPKKIKDTLAAEFRRIGHLYKDKNGNEILTNEGELILKGLQSRFAMGEMSPSGFIRGFKNLGYATTIGNPLGAITQLGDTSFSLTQFGIRDTLKAILHMNVRAPGTVKGILDKESIGLTNALEEIYSDPAKFKRTLDFAMRWGQFNRMDKFGKDTILRSALNNAQRTLKTDKGHRAFMSKWGQYFEGETALLIEDIKKFSKPYERPIFAGKKAGQTIEDIGRLTDRMKLWLWHELSNVQPISLSEMPRGYLDHPNGRVFYMLKTFTIKQLDFMRRSVFREYANGNYTKGTKNLASFVAFWTAMNGAADGIKAGLTSQEDFKVSDAMVENLLQLFLYNRYTADRFVDDGVTIGALAFLAPPVPYVDRPIRALVDASKGNSPVANLAYPIPIVGPVIAKRLKEQEKRDKKLFKTPSEISEPMSEINKQRKEIIKELYKGSLDK